MEEQGKEEEMRQREFCVWLSFPRTLFLGGNVAPAEGLVRFSGKRKKQENEVLSMSVAVFLRSRGVLDPTWPFLP